MNFKDFLFERQGKYTNVEKQAQYGKGITFIDIDETVFRTFAKILVKDKNTGKVRHELDNQQFNSYTLKDDEEYDFQQFRDSNLFLKTSIPIPQTINRIKRMIKQIESTERGTGSRIVFLTAREDFDSKDGVIATFEKYGIKIKKPTTYIERSGNVAAKARTLGQPITTEQAKKKIMMKYLKTGEYRRVRLIDDYKPNLQALLNIRDNLPQDIEQKVRKKYDVPEDIKAIQFFALWVKPDGSLQRIK